MRTLYNPIALSLVIAAFQAHHEEMPREAAEAVVSCINATPSGKITVGKTTFRWQPYVYPEVAVVYVS